MAFREKLAREFGNVSLDLIERSDQIERLSIQIETAYAVMANCVRGEEMSQAEIAQQLKADPNFLAWYNARFPPAPEQHAAGKEVDAKTSPRLRRGRASS